MIKANVVSGGDVFNSWRDDVRSGKPPVLYPVGASAFAPIQVGPGIVTLLGGAPGSGKTALAMQWVIDALRLTPSLRAVVCNVEMSLSALLDRQLARLSGIDLSAIRHRRVAAEHAGRLEDGFATIGSVADRLTFVQPPFDLANVVTTVAAFGAGLVLIDYLQRVRPPGNHADKRLSVDSTMDYLRQFAGAGVAVLAVAAVGRTKDRLGRSSYAADGLGLASFKESGELEYGADNAYLLCPNKDGHTVTLRCVKDRNGEPLDLHLTFNRTIQRFYAPTPDGSDRRAAIKELLDSTAPSPRDRRE